MNSKVRNILIDADRNGVTIYVDDKVCYMSGNGIYICRDLYPNRIRDIDNITVVKDQCGIYFIDYFKKMGFNVNEIYPKAPYVCLPRLDVTYNV